MPSHNFQKKARQDEDFKPGKSRKSGYYDSNLNDWGCRKELQKIKGLLKLYYSWLSSAKLMTVWSCLKMSIIRLTRHNF